MIEQPCPTCGGKTAAAREPVGAAPRKSIGDVVDLPVTDALAFFESIPLRATGAPRGPGPGNRPADPQGSETIACASCATSDSNTSPSGRSADSLSGGEAQRIRLATQIGSRLVGVLYILDEPSIGLHQRDNARLLRRSRSSATSATRCSSWSTDEEDHHLAAVPAGTGAQGPTWSAERIGSPRRAPRRARVADVAEAP